MATNKLGLNWRPIAGSPGVYVEKPRSEQVVEAPTAEQQERRQTAYSKFVQRVIATKTRPSTQDE